MTRCVVGGHIGRLGSAVASIWSFSRVETSRCFGVVQRRRSASRGHLESSTFKEGAGSTEFADLSTLVFEECRRARRLGRIDWHCSRDRHVVYGRQRLTDSQSLRPYTFTLPLLTFDPLSLASQVVELWNRSRCFEPRGFVFAAISRGAVAVRSLACALLCARHLSFAPSLSYHCFRTIALARTIALSRHRSLVPSKGAV